VQRVILRSRLKSSILAVKYERLQLIPVLKQELAEKDAIIVELGRQLAAARDGGGGPDNASTSSKYQEELARIQSEYLILSILNGTDLALEEAACVVVDMVQPPHPGFVDSRSVLERLKHVPTWLKDVSRKQTPK